jgi:hypothetical protein
MKLIKVFSMGMVEQDMCQERKRIRSKERNYYIINVFMKLLTQAK